MLPIAVLAGGFATRLGELAGDKPKSLIEVAGKPFVSWQMELLRINGFKDVVFCVSHKAKEIQKYLGNGSNFGLNIEYSFDGESQLGTGGAVKKAIPMLGTQFAVLYGDSYLPTKCELVENFFRQSQALAVMAVYKNHNQFDTSNVTFKTSTKIEYFKSKENNQALYIDYGLSYFRSNAFDLAEQKESFDLAELCWVLGWMNQLEGFEVYERFYEIGSMQGIQELSRELERFKNEF